MTDEEYLRNRLDRLNQNSHYGIMIDTEITDIVRSHIKRLEEMKMKATSVQMIENVKEMHFTIEKSGVDEITKIIVGASTNDDIFEFHFSGDGCVVFADQWFNMVADKAYKTDFESEKNKRMMMERENSILREKIKALEKENNKLKTRINILTDSFTGCEKDQKIRELEEINENLKKHVKYHIDDKDKLIKRIYELKKELALEKAANEAQHKFIREYAGKGTEVQFNYAIDDAKEVSYVIVDKEEYNKKNEDLIAKVYRLSEENKKLKEENFCVKSRINAFKNTNGKLQDEVLELKYQLKDIQATKEVVEQKLSTRAGILDQAKKCVCGQREQDYGTPESNFKLIADLWNDYLKKERLGRSKAVVDAVDVSMMMALMKIARIKNGGGSGDSFVDLAGYAACGGEIWHGQKVKDQN